MLLAAVVAGVLAGAGQLGLAYGLGVARIARSFDGGTVNQWYAQLSWVSWFAMVAVVVAAVVTERLARRRRFPRTVAAQLALAAAAALGAAIVAPLSMQPALGAQLAGASPVRAVGLCAALGAVVGLLAALTALRLRPAGWNALGLAGGVWFLALFSVLPSLGPDDPLPSVRLGVPDSPWFGGTRQGLAVATMPVLALLAGAATGALGRWRGLPTRQVAAAGVVGPAMLALAYLLAGPGRAADGYQVAPYWAAVISVAAGALGSALVTVARWPLTVGDTTGAQSATSGESPQHLVDAGTDRRHHDPGEETRDSMDTPESSISQELGTGAAPIPAQRAAHDADAGQPGDDHPAAGASTGMTTLSWAGDAPTVGWSGESATPRPGAGSDADPGAHRPTTEDFWPAWSTQQTTHALADSYHDGDRWQPEPPEPVTRTSDSWDAFAAAEREIGRHSGPLNEVRPRHRDDSGAFDHFTPGPPQPEARPAPEPFLPSPAPIPNPAPSGQPTLTPVPVNPPPSAPTPLTQLPVGPPPVAPAPIAPPPVTPTPIAPPPVAPQPIAQPSAPPTPLTQLPTAPTPVAPPPVAPQPVAPPPTVPGTATTAPTTTAPSAATPFPAAPPFAADPAPAPRPTAEPLPTLDTPPVEPYAAPTAATPTSPPPAPAPAPREINPELLGADRLAAPARREVAPEPAAPAGTGTTDTTGDANPTGKRARRGLFRRNKGADEGGKRGTATDQVPEHDEEYVDWVSGLGADDDVDPSLRRSLRPSARDLAEE